MKRILPLVLLALSNVSFAQSGTSVVTEYEIKAAFLYNFAKFVDWPTSAFQTDSTTIIIGILGDDPFGSILDEIVADTKVQNKRLQVKRFKQPGDLTFCHILYVSKSETKRLQWIQRKISGASTLTIGESSDFLERGGMIRLVNKRNKVRFEINPMAASKAGLRISSRLLKLAENLKNTLANGRVPQ